MFKAAKAGPQKAITGNRLSDGLVVFLTELGAWSQSIGDALLVTDGGTALACCASGMKISHEVVNQSAGERVRGDLHIQTVNSLHERIKTFLRARRGVATKYLDNYLRWFHLAGLQHAPTPRACLNAAIGPQLKIAIPT